MNKYFVKIYTVEYSTGVVGEESGSMLPQVIVKRAHFRTNCLYSTFHKKSLRISRFDQYLHSTRLPFLFLSIVSLL